MRKHAYLLYVLLVLSMTANAQVNIPQVIPSLQNWKAGKGKLILPEKGRIIVAPESEKLLRETAEIVAKDLKDMFGWNYPVISGKPERHSVYLSLDDSPSSPGEEGYELEIRNHVMIKASTVKGVFWGTRTLLQMIHNQPLGLLKGKTADCPQYTHRGFMIDVARKFFPIDFLRDYVKILSFYKMNELQIHLNDNGFVEFFDNDWNKTYSAFRLESERFPGLTAQDGAYSKEEFRELQKLAARYGVNIIPEIDVPAHSLAFTHYNPNLAADKKEYGMDHLDLYKKEVYDFLDTMFDEYLSGDDPVFLGPDVHIGTDEYNLKEAEQFRHFTDYYLKYVSKYGKNARLWGSLKHMKGSTPVDLKGKTVNAWNYNWMDLETAMKEGAKVINTCDEFLYIVPSVNYYHDYLDYQWLYESWTPRMMKKDTEIAPSPNLLGAMFAVWNDHVGNGVSRQDVHARVFPALQVIAEKLWKGENSANVPFGTFNALCKQTPEAPGVNLQARIDTPKDLTPPGQEIILQGNDTTLTTVPEIGYPYAVEFDICPDKEPIIDAVLFKGPNSVFITNWQNTGKFAFRRDGYEFVFHSYRLPSGQWTKIRVEGDAKGTSLYVNGQKQERLEGRTSEFYNFKARRKDRMWHQETLIFPLHQIGDLQMGYKGRIKNVRTLDATAQPATIDPPLMGWSSWNTYRIHISEDLIKSQADAMADRGLKDAGYKYINIDDGFFGHRDKNGKLQTHPERFPNGLKCVADYIHSKGLKAGIYSDAGSNTCGSIWDQDPNGIGVGLYGHEKQDADLFFNEWGFDFIKIDYCGAGQQLDLEEEKRYTEIRRAIDEVCKRNISINICRWAYPGTWVKQLARSWRISPDIRPSWGSIKSIIGKNLYLSAYAGDGHYNDMDMLEIGRGLKPEEEEVHFGMWCIMNSPLLIGCDLTTIPEASLKLLKNKELIALNQDPLGLQAYVVQHENAGYVLVKDIVKKRGNIRAVALYNPSDTLCRFNVPFPTLELDGKVKVRDLVKQQSEGTKTDGLSYEVPAHSVKILSLEAEQRLEPVRYEAEWAYLPQFNDLGKRSRGVAYVSHKEASGRMVVSNLGGEVENYAEWNEVYSAKGGKYKMHISYLPTPKKEREIPDRKLEVEVNGEKTMLENLETDAGKGTAVVTLPIQLRPGNNVIRMGSPYTWTPDIDCFTLEKDSSVF